MCARYLAHTLHTRLRLCGSFSESKAADGGCARARLELSRVVPDCQQSRGKRRCERSSTLVVEFTSKIAFIDRIYDNLGIFFRHRSCTINEVLVAYVVHINYCQYVRLGDFY